MASKWTKAEEFNKRRELQELYVNQNKSMSEIATILNVGESTIYDRLVRLGIPSLRSKKFRFNNKRTDLQIPKVFSMELAEFIGIMLGDGHLTPTQITITLGNKEFHYVQYVAKLINKLFMLKSKIIKRKGGYYIVYFGSTEAVRWLVAMGLKFNKVKNQVDAPKWIFEHDEYIKSFLRGFFDTDGSIYKLKFGVQLSFTNRSLPLLESIRKGLSLLDFSPSNISYFRIFLTKRWDIFEFFDTINPANVKHQERYLKFKEKKVS